MGNCLAWSPAKRQMVKRIAISVLVEVEDDWSESTAEGFHVTWDVDHFMVGHSTALTVLTDRSSPTFRPVRLHVNDDPTAIFGSDPQTCGSDGLVHGPQ